MSNEKRENPNKRFLGKIKNENSKYGVFQKALVDNPSPTNADGTPNTYYQGNLIWVDAKTGKKFLIKQLKLGNYVNADMLQKGFVAHFSIDLGSEYEVQELA